MPLKQIPTIFVALTLAPDQSDVFNTFCAQAQALLRECGDSADVQEHAVANDLTFLDAGSIRAAIGWFAKGRTLMLAVGSHRDARDIAQIAPLVAGRLRQLADRADGLFAVQDTVWQVADLPLTTDTMVDHAQNLGLTGQQANANPQFLTFEPSEVSADPAPGVTDRLTALRDAMSEANEDPSWAMQASALALSSACVLVTPPVGIAMLTYAVLRQSSDMDLIPRKPDISELKAPSWPVLSDPVPMQIAPFSAIRRSTKAALCAPMGQLAT